MANCLRRSSGIISRLVRPNYYIHQGAVTAIASNTLLRSSLSGSQIRSLQTAPILCKRVAFNLSDIGEGIREVIVKEWFVKEGDVVQQFDELCEVQSDKASVTITSRYDGKILKLHHKIDDMALVGKPLVDFDVEDEQQDDDSSDSDSSSDDEVVGKQSPKSTEANVADGRLKALATPAVRRIAMEHKVDLSKVTPTGRDGRVLKGDVLEYLNLVPKGTNVSHPSNKKAPQSVVTKVKTMPVVADRIEQLKGVRRAMLKSMTETLKIPHFGYCDEVEMTNLIAVRESLKQEAVERGVKLTFMPFFIKAASLALLKYPILNSSLDEANESVIYKAAHNISVAMDTPDGLVVPNIKNCQDKSLGEITTELSELMERARKGQLQPNDFANGTFSISNIGIIGGTYTHPCIMAPQVAIGALGRTKLTPKFDSEGNLVKASILNVSWSADHRVIDGVTMANFSNLWKKYLENPNLFFL